MAPLAELTGVRALRQGAKRLLTCLEACGSRPLGWACSDGVRDEGPRRPPRSHSEQAPSSSPLPFRLLHGTVLGEVFEVALAVREVERQRPFEVLADQPVEEELEPLALESYRTTPRDKGSRIKRQHTRPMGATWKGGSRGC